MSPSQIWSDPVFSKVIANFIWAVLITIALWITGRKKAGEYDFFKIITIKLPAWYLLVAINVFFIAITLFPTHGIAITSSLLTIILVISIVRYRNATAAGAHPIQQEGRETEKGVIYRTNGASDHSLEFSLEKNYENNVPVGEKGAGSFEFGPDKIVHIKRTNRDGREVVHIKRYLGGNKYKINKDLDRNGKRVIQIVFEAKVSAGMHKLWFVAKKAGKTDWIHQANKFVEITNINWEPYRLHFYVPADEDFTLHFEDREITVAPSSIQIKNLEIFEPQE